MPKRAAVLLLVLVAQASAPNHAHGNPLDHTWYEYRSAHFVVLSDQDEPRVARAIDALELFRVVVLKVTNARAGSEAVPLDFFLFDDTGDFQATIKNPQILGYMRPGLRTQYMVAGKGVIGMDAQHVIFHEYVHYLLRNGGSVALHPKWYDEGLAEMLAATRFREDENRIVLGGDIPQRIENLRAGIYVSLAEVLSTNDLSEWHPYRVAVFYSKAFALVNYLHVSRLVGNDRYPQMTEYLRLYSEGVASVPAFEQAFGMPVSSMERELGSFLTRSQRPVLQLPMDRFPRDGSYSRRAVPTQELAYRLGYLMVAANPSGARQLFEHDGLARTDARFRAGVGVSYQMAQTFDRAYEEMQAALALAPNDPVVLQEAADLSSIWCRSEKRPTGCGEMRLEAKRNYLHLLEIEPDRLEADEAYGELLNDLGDPTGAATHLERVYAQAPWNVSTIAELGIAKEEAGEPTEAAPLLRRALVWIESDSALAARVRNALNSAEHTKPRPQDADAARPSSTQQPAIAPHWAPH